MARSNHSVYTAADRFERSRPRKPEPRRQSTRRAALAAALREV